MYSIRCDSSWSRSGVPRTHSCALGPPCVSMFLWRKSLFFTTWERTRIRKITSGMIVFVIVSCFRPCFILRPILCFRGAHCSVMRFICVFVVSRKVCTFFCSAEFCLNSSQAGFWFSAGLRVFLHRGSSHERVFVSAGAARLQIRRQMGSPSRLLSLPWGRFSHRLLICCYIFLNYAIF